MNIKHESETSCYITFSQSVLGGVFYLRYVCCYSLYLILVFQGVKLAVGAPHIPADIIAAFLLCWVGFTKGKVAVKPGKTGELRPGCYIYNELAQYSYFTGHVPKNSIVKTHSGKYIYSIIYFFTMLLFGISPP